MAFGLKYELLCTTKKGNLYTVQISFDGYSGDPVDRNVPLSPFKLVKDKADVIRGTSFEFLIREEVDFEFLEFYTNNNKGIKVELFNPSDDLIWSGFNLPQQYQVPYTPSPSNVSFTATDGLGLLKNEPFTLTGLNSQMDIIRHCIDKIGIDLGYSIAINTFEVTHDHTYTPLAQTQEHSDNFADLNCYEVIEKILNKYDAEITQRKGRWAITCSADKKSERMLYSSAGVYEDIESAPAVLILGYPGSGVDVSPRGILQMGLEPGGHQVKITQDFGKKDSLFSNYDFRKYTAALVNMFDDWTQSGSFVVSQKETKDVSYALLRGFSNVDTDYIDQEIYIPVENVAGENFNVEIDFAPIGSIPNEGIQAPITMTVRMMIMSYVEEYGTWYYLTPTGWSETEYLFELAVASSVDEPTWNKLKVIVPELPVEGHLRVRLYRYKSAGPPTFERYEGVAFSNIKAYFLNEGEAYPAGIEEQAVFTNSTEPSDLPEIEVLASDAPDVINSTLLYTSITRLADGTPTTLWHRLGSSSEYFLIKILAFILASNNRVARQKLTGDIKGTSIGFDSIIKHVYNDNREFEISEGTWDIYEETFNVILLELLPISDETVVFTDIISLKPGSPKASSGGGGGGSFSSIDISAGLQLMDELSKYFELVNKDTPNAYIRVKLPFAGDYELQAFSDAFPAGSSNAFQTPIFDDPLDLDATLYKNFKCGLITDNTTINLNNSSDGDSGIIEVIIDGTGGYVVSLGTMFVKKLGIIDLVTAANTDNFIFWHNVIGDIVYEVKQVGEISILGSFEGYHLPTLAEIIELYEFVRDGDTDADVAQRLADDNNSYWNVAGATNSSGFTARAAGRRLHSDGSLSGFGTDFYLWASDVPGWYGLHIWVDLDDLWHAELGNIEFDPGDGMEARMIKNISDWTEGEIVTDRDGNIYPTVKIGNQVWLKESVRAISEDNGTSIPEVTDDTAWMELSGTAARCDPPAESMTGYGRLYTWSIYGNRHQFRNWFMPSREELADLIDNIDPGIIPDVVFATSFEDGWEEIVAINKAGTLSYPLKSEVLSVWPVRIIDNSSGKFDSLGVGSTGPAGGTIFYIDGTNIYEAAPVTYIFTSAWSNITGGSYAGTNPNVGDGINNTDAIIAQEGHISSAALTCKNLVTNILELPS